jgi:ankyrin repeat protein
VLLTAVDIGYVDLVCWLMQNIKHTDMKSSAECHSSTVAVKDGNLEIIKCPLLTGFPVYEQEDTTAPLMEAVEKGNVEVVKLLLEFGAKVNYFTWKWNNTAAKSSSETSL